MSRLGRIGFRLLELSPLIVLALLVAVYLALPTQVGSTLLSSALFDYPGDPSLPRMTQDQIALNAFRSVADQIDHGYAPAEFGVESSSLKGVVDAAWSVTNEKELRQATIGRTLPTDHKSQAGLEAWEREHQANVYLWVVPVSADATIAYQYIGDVGLLTQKERLALSGPNKMSIRQILQNALGEPGVPLASLNSGGGSGDSSRSVNVNSWLAGGRVWESYLIYPTEAMMSQYTPDLGSFTLDPTSKDGRAWLERFTKRLNADVIIVGPLDGTPALLRAPVGRDRGAELEAPRALGSVLWPKRVEGSSMSEPTGFSLTTRERDLTGAKWGILAVAGENSGGAGLKPSVIALAAMQRSPAAEVLREQWGSTPWRKVQAWLAPRYTFVIGFLGVLFLASLVASPTAFVVERRVTEEAEMERERERIRREANERVFARLEALSHEVEAASKAASGTAEGELERASKDIEETLVDLRRLLGDSNGKAAQR